MPRYYQATSFWLEIGTNLVLWVPCVAGGLVLLRGRPSGFYPLYALAALLLLGWTVLLHPDLYRLLGRPPVWVAYRNWPVGVAALALVVSAHLFTLRFVPAEPADRHHPWLSELGLLLGIAALYTSCCYGRRGVEREAGEVVRRANAAYEEGRQEEALGEWAVVIDRYPFTSAWGLAIYNTGIHERDQGRYGEAITRFESLLGSGLDDRDPSGYLMEAYQNYHHQACLQMSVCYEALGDYPSALRFAVLARDAYPYQSWCGTCLMEAGQALHERIQRLERLAKDAR
jgi:tetratricopeptide (TPR) repeat protein